MGLKHSCQAKCQAVLYQNGPPRRRRKDVGYRKSSHVLGSKFDFCDLQEIQKLRELRIKILVFGQTLLVLEQIFLREDTCAGAQDNAALLVDFVERRRIPAPKRDSKSICEQGLKRSYFADSSNSRIQSFFFSTSRGREPSGGPTIPSFSIKSISRAARP
jgi:hypothetical protein